MSFKILIADDEPLIRVDLKESLEGIGYEVVAQARDGREAFNLLKRSNPDVVILDIKMPHMSGIDLAREIGNKYPVILLTAYSEKHLIEQARDAGVMAYLTKPFAEKNIAPAIELSVKHFVERCSLVQKVSRLQDELETRKLIERAKGLLMEYEYLTEGQAYQRIRRMSMDKNKPMKEIAQAIIIMFG
jgi:response regulator NasT